ncbi:MAG: glycoside hydrolase family 18 protein [bacterium]
MKKRVLLVISFIVFLGIGSYAAECSKKLVAYYTYYNSTVIPYNKLTHICHAFIFPESDGTVTSPWGYLEPSMNSAAHAAGVKVLVSIGGADDAAKSNFSTIAADAGLRQTFATSVYDFISTNNYDGVDFDWEFPESYSDRANQNLMIQAVRNKFNASPAPAPNYIISMATSSGDYRGKYNDYATLSNYVDFYNLMSYDYHGSWTTEVGPTSPLYYFDSEGCVSDSVYYMKTTRSVPAEKINLGVPFYGLTYFSSTALHAYGSGTQLAYSTIKSNYVDSSDWTVKYDNASKVPYVTKNTPPGIIVYDDAASILLKCNYALKTQGLGGIFMWEISHDEIGGNHPLLDSMYSAWSDACPVATPTPGAEDTTAKFSITNIKIYPNPIKKIGKVHLTFEIKGYQKIRVTIFNSNGEKLRMFEAAQTDTSLDWNCGTANGELAASGLYVAMFEGIDSKGNIFAVTSEKIALSY